MLPSSEAKPMLLLTVASGRSLARSARLAGRRDGVQRCGAVKVLFIARHFTYFRNFDSVVTALAARGHRVHLAADRDDTLGGGALVDRLVASSPNVTSGVTPIHEWGRYRRVSGALRLALDYLRYSDSRYETMPKIRQRAYERTPAGWCPRSDDRPRPVFD